MSNPPIKTISQKVVYKNKWLTLREDEIVRSGGKPGIYGVVEKPDFAIVIPVDGDKVHMVSQYRYTIGQRQLEFPQGAWEDNPEADPTALAAGELREETGLVAKTMEYLGFQYLAYGFCDQGYHIYVARDLTQGERQLDAEEEDLTCHVVSLTDLEAKIISGEIKDASTCNAFGLARLKGFI